MAHPLVEALGIAELERTLLRLTSTTHNIGGSSGAGGGARQYTRHDIDAIHLGLAKKQRQSGSLGLNR